MEMTPGMKHLYDAMSDFSEDRWFAQWLRGFDKQLYRDVFHNRNAYDLTSAEKERFQWLGRIAGGWWYWRWSDENIKFLTFEEMDKIVGLD